MEILSLDETKEESDESEEGREREDETVAKEDKCDEVEDKVDAEQKLEQQEEGDKKVDEEKKVEEKEERRDNWIPLQPPTADDQVKVDFPSETKKSSWGNWGRKKDTESGAVSQGSGSTGSVHSKASEMNSSEIEHALQTKKGKSILYVHESWDMKTERLRKSSPFGHLPNWKLRSLIVKFGDDCRQEHVALQMITQFHRIFTEAKLPLFVKPYDILVLSPVTCLIETVTNSMSLHQLKKEHNGISLSEYFAQKSGGTETRKYKNFQCNFIDSVAAYSLICYIMQIKDRHNGNILILNSGHIVHIDFGFMLSNSPGNINFESSPFKLTQEYIDFIGGIDGPMWAYFKASMNLGFTELRKHSEKIIGLVEMLLQTNTKLPCFQIGAPEILEGLRARLYLGKTDKQCEEYMDGLIQESIGNWRTMQYEKFQYNSNGILF
eukprot:TRINITY_DN6561_c0_g1_i2.p1 TRINITY_DN6561_c0_g1~~TRINITY_DN6561_c0_g1_i2.p1  ORF type:complete len:437 (-),score=96.84 TRINITY_DN6561_c0_g1_i2:41-1351(-)